jgi:hypothetical protein
MDAFHVASSTRSGVPSARRVTGSVWQAWQSSSLVAALAPGGQPRDEAARLSVAAEPKSTLPQQPGPACQP